MSQEDLNFRWSTFTGKEIKGDAWDRLVPLGAMWGNDPGINSAIDPNAILQQNVINPMAPLYATETLGYGGRLSGPNDGSVIQNAIIEGQLVPRARISSCMSCHGVAEWPMKSFLLPGPADTSSPQALPEAQGNYEYIYKPGSFQFNRWFQSRPGNVPQDPGTAPLDYDMNIAFKALPLWYKSTKGEQKWREFLNQVPSGVKSRLLKLESLSYKGIHFKKNNN